MVAPLLIAGGLYVGLSSVYNIGRAYDNIRFWDAYYRRTGYRPKYPWRTGAYDYMSFASKSIGAGIGGYGAYKKFR